nr:EOG090X0HUX [Scapholeberis mucronata]
MKTNILIMKSILQLTLAIIKPDVVRVPFVLQEIRETILQNGFYVIQSGEFTLSRQQAENFYSEHFGKFFHQRLVTFMNSGPIHAYILAHPKAIHQWRELMGPTKTFKAQFDAPSTIRGIWGLTDTRNSTHGSDSETTAFKEIKYFFPEFDYSQWVEKEEPLLRKGKCKIDPFLFIHRCD